MSDVVESAMADTDQDREALLESNNANKRIVVDHILGSMEGRINDKIARVADIESKMLQVSGKTTKRNIRGLRAHVEEEAAALAIIHSSCLLPVEPLSLIEDPFANGNGMKIDELVAIQEEFGFIPEAKYLEWIRSVRGKLDTLAEKVKKLDRIAKETNLPKKTTIEKTKKPNVNELRNL